MIHKQFNSEYGEVHYWINKNNNPNAKCIVFTHGVTANHTMFEKQAEYFSKDYTVISWDIPLHGLSKPYTSFSYKQSALELYNILNTENIDDVILVGASLGGYPSQMFAYLYPNMVSGFVALDTTPFGLQYYSKQDLFWLRQVKSMVYLIPNSILKKSMAKSVSKTEYSYNLMMDMLLPLSKKDIAQQMDIAYGKFADENIDMKLSCPVIILLGDNDNTGKIKHYCKRWSNFTGYPLHIIKNASHFSNGDNPEQVNYEIENFIKSL